MDPAPAGTLTAVALAGRSRFADKDESDGNGQWPTTGAPMRLVWRSLPPSDPAAGSARAVCLAREHDDLMVMLHEPGPGSAHDAAVLYAALRLAAGLLLPRSAGVGDRAGAGRIPGGTAGGTRPATAPGPRVTAAASRRLDGGAVGDAARWLRRATGGSRGGDRDQSRWHGLLPERWPPSAPSMSSSCGRCRRGRALLRELRGHHQIIAATFPDDIREDPDAEATSS